MAFKRVLFSCGVSFCKIQKGTTRKAILQRNSAVFLSCAKSVSDDDCSVLYGIFFTVVEKQPPLKYVYVYRFQHAILLLLPITLHASSFPFQEKENFSNMRVN